MTTKQYLDYIEVAAMFGVSDLTVRKWVADGLLRPTVLGHRTVRFDPEELDRFAAERKGGAA